MNLLGVEPPHEEAVIIGMGPSKDIILGNPTFASGRTLAMVNRIGYAWPHHFDYWFSYHAERAVRWWFKRESMGLPLDGGLFVCSANKQNDLKLIPHINIKEQVRGLNSGGTSSLLAAIALLSAGCKPIHIFGVDLNGNEWSRERKFWEFLKEEPLVFHGLDWFHRKNFHEEKR